MAVDAEGPDESGDQHSEVDDVEQESGNEQESSDDSVPPTRKVSLTRLLEFSPLIISRAKAKAWSHQSNH